MTEFLSILRKLTKNFILKKKFFDHFHSHITMVPFSDDKRLLLVTFSNGKGCLWQPFIIGKGYQRQGYQWKMETFAVSNLFQRQRLLLVTCPMEALADGKRLPSA